MTTNQDLYRRAETFLADSPLSGHVAQVVPLDSNVDMLIQTTSPRGDYWHIVAGGRELTRVTTSLEYAMLIWIAARTGQADDAYRYAARVLRLGDER